MARNYDDIKTIDPGAETPTITKLKLSEAGSYQRRIGQLGFNSLIWPMGDCAVSERRIMLTAIKKLVAVYELENIVTIKQ